MYSFEETGFSSLFFYRKHDNLIYSIVNNIKIEKNTKKNLVRSKFVNDGSWFNKSWKRYISNIR